LAGLVFAASNSITLGGVTAANRPSRRKAARRSMSADDAAGCFDLSLLSLKVFPLEMYAAKYRAFCQEPQVTALADIGSVWPDHPGSGCGVTEDVVVIPLNCTET
jgi:hypothetical protein